MIPRWEDLPEGTPGPAPLVLGPLTRTDFVRYQGASGDMNPIHHDETFARAAGYQAPLGVGMLPAGALAAWAAGWLGPENVRRVKVRWKPSRCGPATCSPSPARWRAATRTGASGVSTWTSSAPSRTAGWR